MTDLDPIARLQKLFGGCLYTKAQEIKRYPNAKMLYRWEVCSSRAVGVALTVYPLMSERRKAKIKENLALWKACKQGKHAHSRAIQGA